MSSNLFKTKYLINPDGSNSATVLTDTNTAFIHTYMGDDSTGDGTRAYPYRSMSKAILKGLTYIVFRGVINEPFSTNKKIYGDDINQTILFSNYSVTMGEYGTPMGNFTSDNLTSMINGVQFHRIIGNTVTLNNWSMTNSYSLYRTGFITNGLDNSGIIYAHINNTSYSVNINLLSRACWFKNWIITNVLDTKQFGSASLRYCVFSTSTVFKYLGTPIVTPSWTNDSVANMGLLRTALINAGLTLTYTNILFPLDSFGNETCKIIKENRNGGTHPNIFNKYDGSGNVLDWTLNPDINNEALWSSDIGGFVGCFRPAASINSTSGNALGSVVDVDVNGNDTVNVADLMVKNIDDTISFQTSASGQVWNRIIGTSTITIPNGRVFKGVNGITLDGSPFGHYIGKHQNLMDATHINEGGTLTTGYTYKVCSIIHDITHAIVYNGVQYLPDYFFKCIAGVTSFSLVSTGSGVYLQRVLCTPLESIEIIPYSDVNNISGSYPRFSSPIGTNCLMLQYSATNGYGKVSGTPVLFGDYTFCTELAAIRDKISYYDGFAVTNADQEFYSLVGNSKFITAAPILNYLRVEVNGHFNAAYDY